MSTKRILIGLDGLGWDILSPMIDDGRLPTLMELCDNGTAGNLESTHPPWTPCAWPSLQSGRNPGAHGVFDFFTRTGYDKSLINRRNVDAPYLPDVAAAKGKSVLSINFPVTHPVPEYENGAVVPGYLAPEDAAWSPEELREEFEAEYGEYTIYPEYGETENAVKGYVDVARGRRDVATFLDERYDWDLLAVQFQVTDSVFHDLEDPASRYEILEAVDRYVEDIINLTDDPTVFVVSDHGMGEYQWTFYINTWLAEEGYCETIEGDPGYFRSKKSELKGESEKEQKSDSPFATAAQTGMSAASKVGLSPRRVHSLLDSVGLAKHIERLLPSEVLVSAQNQTVDWEHSDAFQIFFNSCGIHLNRAEREPSGTVSDNDYDELREELTRKLERLTDPDGIAVFDAVKPKEDVYQGPHLEDAPDLLLYPRDYDYDVSGSIVGPFRRNKHMNHKPLGLIIAAGPDIESDTIEQASIVDVAPTVAATLGIPVDVDRDGEVLPIVDQMYDEEKWGELADDTWDDNTTESSVVEERLANLGYME
ncbi:alkaline phosphatase family protein [Halobacteria archaeon AArc-m2/3/4]|uniref:Alkaline phosphatase family protein n=1 Tax=Natronoglomus mannanivorans TaxID=2979990 RepID=A0ABT2QJ08_9EURY|nr:alkaline phosphatase family protein [Halobacteria archaeon AArc-m2/3/4]